MCGGMVEMKRFLHITQVCVISKNSIGLCDFPSHFFVNQGKNLSNCSAEPANAELQLHLPSSSAGSTE